MRHISDVQLLTLDTPTRTLRLSYTMVEPDWADHSSQTLDALIAHSC